MTIYALVLHDFLCFHVSGNRSASCRFAVQTWFKFLPQVLEVLNLPSRSARVYIRGDPYQKSELPYAWNQFCWNIWRPSIFLGLAVWELYRGLFKWNAIFHLVSKSVSRVFNHSLSQCWYNQLGYQLGNELVPHLVTCWNRSTWKFM